MFSSNKPYTAVTVSIERLTSEQYEEDDLSGIPDLVEIIKIQSTGPSEAARALRKKLKYGNVHRQLRALAILNGLIENAGSRFQRTFIDEPLLERLLVCGTAGLSDPAVRKKCQVLFALWARDFKKTPGLEGIASLHKEQPRKKQEMTQAKSKVLRETERDPFEDAADEEDEEDKTEASASKSPVSSPVAKSSQSGFDRRLSHSGPSSSPTVAKVKKDKKSSKKKSKKAFNLEEEKPRMKATIADSSVASTNLLNALQFINREQERVSENKDAFAKFETCKLLRRHVLRYIQHVESEQWLGALINANDQLVTALMTFEQLDASIDADSDSEDELAEQAHAYRMATAKGKSPVSETADSLAGLHIGHDPEANKSPAKPPRPAPPVDVESDDDEDNPFGDQNALETPAMERGEPKWRVV